MKKNMAKKLLMTHFRLADNFTQYSNYSIKGLGP